jgi:hypothetical protein
MSLENLSSFTQTHEDKMNVNQFIATWPQNFMLQAVTPTTTIEATLKDSATRIDSHLYNLQKISDKDLMELISYMRQLSLLLYVYSNQTRLLQSLHDIDLLDFRNTILWTSDILERHLIVKYDIK